VHRQEELAVNNVVTFSFTIPPPLPPSPPDVVFPPAEPKFSAVKICPTYLAVGSNPEVETPNMEAN
jgi:hypothetical protein